LFVIRFQRDEVKIKELTIAVNAFLAQVDEMLTKLKGIK
jgi:hypothetical protein